VVLSNLEEKSAGRERDARA